MDENDKNQEERPRIKVTDRRKFNVDGVPRSTEEGADAAAADVEAENPQPAPAPSAAEPSTAEATDSPSAPEPVAADPPSAAPDEAAPDAAEADDDPRIAAPQPSMADLPRDFSAFVESMYLEAMLYMGAMPHPRTGEVMEDIELARYKIDLLAMIAEKTEGNLTADEKRQLDEITYQLRMVFVQKNG